MPWPVNVGETVQAEARPSWKPWVLLFICLAGACVAWAVWSWPHGKPVDMRFWLRAAVTPLLSGCVLLGLRINRYEQSVAASVASEEATARTRLEWQQWAQCALRVMACAAITPERELVAAMTAVPPTATASPHKGRKFHGWPDDGETDPLQWAFGQLARKLSEVQPDWSAQVRSIHVQGDFEVEHIERAWQAALAGVVHHPPTAQVVPFDVNDWNSMFDEPDARPRLFVAVQTWLSSREPRNFSELAVALLVSGKDAEEITTVPPTWIGRPMTTSAETLDADLSMLFDYSGVDAGTVACMWLTGVPADFAGKMALLVPSPDGEAVPSYPVDHYLGPPHSAQYWLALVAAAEPRGNGNPQLVVGHAADGLTLHLITG